MSNSTAAAESESKGRVARRWKTPTVRHALRRVLYVYTATLLLAITVQAVCLFLLWRPPQAWVSFGARFATSPGIAGILALAAAILGAWSLSKQLEHTKEKAADEAWWQQFEWVTDRLISSDDKEEKATARLPLSLAFDLMTSLSNTARAPFQNDAVGGILAHYLNDFSKRDTRSPQQRETATSDDASIDAAGAKSLRNLIRSLPEESPSSASARRVLQAYERASAYEEEVQKALRHRFGPAHSEPAPDFGVDAIVEIGSQKILVEVKQSVPNHHLLERTRTQLHRVMESEGATRGVIITPPPSLASSANDQAKYRLQELSNDGIHLIEWDPSERSSSLQDKIRATVTGEPLSTGG